MAKFLSNSTPCVKTELDLFYVPPTNTSIESGGWCEYSPLTTLENAQIEFNVPSSNEHYIHLNKTLLYLTVQFNDNLIAKGESQPSRTVTTRYGPINNLASSLFSQVDVSLKGENIESSSKTYAYKAYLTDLLNFGKGAKESHAQCSLFYKDSSGHMDSLEIDPSKNTHNEGLVSRRAVIIDGKGSVDLVTRIHSDIFNTDRLLLTGVDINIKLYKNDEKFVLMKDDDCTVDMKIVKASLFIRKVKISNEVLLAHNLALEKTTAKYPIKRAVVSSYTISEKIFSYDTPSLSTSILPTRVICGLVDSRAFNGDYKYNPFNFQHFNLKSINLELDSQSVPYYGKGYELDFKNQKYIRGYYTLFESIDSPVFLSGNDILRTDFPSGYTLFAFDISPDLCSGEHFNLLKTGNLILKLIFDTNLAQPVTLVVFMEFDNMIEINKSRKVFIDYQV